MKQVAFFSLHLRNTFRVAGRKKSRSVFVTTDKEKETKGEIGKRGGGITAENPDQDVVVRSRYKTPQPCTYQRMGTDHGVHTTCTDGAWWRDYREGSKMQALMMDRGNPTNGNQRGRVCR